MLCKEHRYCPCKKGVGLFCKIYVALLCRIWSLHDDKIVCLIMQGLERVGMGEQKGREKGGEGRDGFDSNTEY